MCPNKNLIKIIYLTDSARKAQEVQDILGSNFTVKWSKCEIPETQGNYPDILNEDTLENQCKEISQRKAEFVCDQEIYSDIILIEDTSLYLKELLAPGPFIKGWKNDALYKASIGCENKTIVAMCIFTICFPNKEIIQVCGKCEGLICSPNKDDQINKFNKLNDSVVWDEIFIPKRNNIDQKTFAQMSKQEKNKLSHRAVALNSLAKVLQQYFKI